MTEVLVYFSGGPHDGHARTMPDGRPSWAIPHRPERHGAFYFGTSLGPLPQPAIYTRAFPPRYERVLTADLIVRKGMRLEDVNVAWSYAQVFLCVAEGGR